jgi:glucosamine kinase
MNKHSILIAESGSTKTDWCLLADNKKKHFNTQGINPYFLNENEILSIFRNEIKLNPNRTQIQEIHFYGAGINSEDKKKIIERCIMQHFGLQKVYCYSDMLASARSTCKQDKGIACILGTGSNSSYFDGKKLTFKTKALGYILGDEGGGTHLGKKVL